MLFSSGSLSFLLLSLLVPHEDAQELPWPRIEFRDCALASDAIQPSRNHRDDIKKVTTWHDFKSLALDAIPPASGMVTWCSVRKSVRSEVEIGDHVGILLEVVGEMCGCMRSPGSDREPRGYGVAGSPRGSFPPFFHNFQKHLDVVPKVELTSNKFPNIEPGYHGGMVLPDPPNSRGLQMVQRVPPFA